jgi:hypothetical protein
LMDLGPRNAPFRERNVTRNGEDSDEISPPEINC